MGEAFAPGSGAYGNEVNPFTQDWREAWWGENYSRLLEIKKKYDPLGLLKCRKRVEFEYGDLNSERSRCMGKLQQDIAEVSG